MEQKKNRVTVYIFEDLNVLSGTITKDIDIPFIPKTVRVNNLLYFSNETAIEAGISLVTSDLVDGSTSLDSTLFTFCGNKTAINPDVTFNLNKSVRGIYTFKYTRPGDREGELSFSLTFED